MASETNALDRTRTYEYDGVGQLVHRVDRNGRIIHYEYDKANRNTFEKWYDPDGTTLVRTISFGYDAAGRLAEASDPSGTYDYLYDALGRVKNETQAIGGLTPDVQYSTLYDGASRQTQMQATIGTTADFKNTYAYDALSRLSSVVQQGVSGGNTLAAKRADLAYNDAGQFTKISRYAGTSTSELVINSFYDYDLAGRLTSLIHTTSAAAPASGWGSGVKAGYQYQYLGQDISSINSYVDGIEYFYYDGANQLAYDNANIYSYDANGNGNRNGGVVGENNQLLSQGYFGYDYDDEGNRASRIDSLNNVRRYIWDFRNRLTAVEEWSPDVEPAEGWGDTYGGGCDASDTYCFGALLYANAEGQSLEFNLSPYYCTF